MSDISVITTNETEIDSSASKDAVGIYFFSAFTIITITVITGNTIVITTICRHERLRMPGNTFIVSLAVSDLLFGIFFPLYNLGQIPRTPFEKAFGSSTACRTIIILVQWIEFNSAYHLVAITFTRYLAITKPLRYHIWLTDRTAGFCVAFIWIATCVTASSVYASSDADTHLGMCRFEVVYPEQLALFLSMTTIVVPAFIMITLYAVMVRIARKQARCIAAIEVCSGMPTGKQHLIRRELKSVMMVSLLVGLFVLAWSPLAIYIIYTTICKCSSNIFVRTTFRLFIYTNYAVNIFIYAGRMKEFRRYVKQDFWCFYSSNRRLSRQSSDGYY